MSKTFDPSAAGMKLLADETAPLHTSFPPETWAVPVRWGTLYLYMTYCDDIPHSWRACIDSGGYHFGRFNIPASFDHDTMIEMLRVNEVMG